jgi:hypothetical protein
LLEPLSRTKLGEAADRAIGRIRATHSEEALAHFERLLQVFHFTGRVSDGYASKATIIDDITFAIREEKAARSFRESKVRPRCDFEVCGDALSRLGRYAPWVAAEFIGTGGHGEKANGLRTSD